MNKKSKYTFVLLASFSIIFLIELIYIQSTNEISSLDKKQKNDFVRLSKLPDLAINSNTSYIRHRSLINTFDIYSNDPELREYERSTYSIRYSKAREIR